MTTISNRNTFDAELRLLQDEIVQLGSLVETNLLRSAQVLHERDVQNAAHIIKEDKAVNRKRIELGNQSFRLIITQQPMAGDMRLIAAVLEIVGELERIHDYAKGIARITQMLESEPGFDDVIALLPEMAQKAVSMLHDSLVAFTTRDDELAHSVAQRDDEVDLMFNEIYARIVHLMHEQPQRYDAANKIGWAIHNIERAADRVINICEWVIYMVTGEYSELEPEEFDAP